MWSERPHSEGLPSSDGPAETGKRQTASATDRALVREEVKVRDGLLEAGLQGEASTSRIRELKKGLYVPGYVSGQKVRFLIDTGSSETFLSYQKFLSLLTKSGEDLLADLMPADGIDVRQSGGTPLVVHWRVRTNLVIGRTEALMDILVADIEDEGILGLDFLLSVDGVLDLKTLQINCGGDIVSCNDKDPAHHARVYIKQDVVIPSETEVIVPCYVRRIDVNTVTPCGMLMAENSNQLHEKGLLVSRTLVNTEKNILPLRVFNYCGEDITIKKNTAAAKLVPVEIKPQESQCEDQTGFVNFVKIREENEEVSVPLHLQDLMKRSSENLEEDQVRKLAELLNEFQYVFSKHDMDFGCTKLMTHNINTGNAPPVKERDRRLSEAQQAIVEKKIEALLQNDLIEPSSSPYASPLVLVKRKDGGTRMCCDKKLNSATLEDAYPLPRISDSLDALSGSKWFSTLDLTSGYHQVMLDEDAKLK